MRKSVVVALVLCLALGMLASPAAGKKKKKKKKPVPVTFEAEGSFLVANPADYTNGTSITRNEFAATCAIPVTQGLDGFVVELSEEISAVTANAQLTGSDATGAHDVDMYYFDAECNSTGATSTEATDEFGVFPAGTKWILVTAFLGVEIEFTLKAEELIT